MTPWRHLGHKSYPARNDLPDSAQYGVFPSMGNKTAIFSLIMAIICFGIAIVPLLGLVLAADPLGRFVFAGLWTFLGFVWIRNFRRAQKKASEE
jgi:hypothetical protein